MQLKEVFLLSFLGFGKHPQTQPSSETMPHFLYSLAKVDDPDSSSPMHPVLSFSPLQRGCKNTTAREKQILMKIAEYPRVLVLLT